MVSCIIEFSTDISHSRFPTFSDNDGNICRRVPGFGIGGLHYLAPDLS